MITKITNFIEEYIIHISIIFIILLIILIGVLGTISYEQQKDFLIKNNCKLIEVKKENTKWIIGFSNNGTMQNGLMIENDEKCYTCKDNIKYCF